MAPEASPILRKPQNKIEMVKRMIVTHLIKIRINIIYRHVRCIMGFAMYWVKFASSIRIATIRHSTGYDTIDNYISCFAFSLKHTRQNVLFSITIPFRRLWWPSSHQVSRHRTNTQTQTHISQQHMLRMFCVYTASQPFFRPRCLFCSVCLSCVEYI